MNVLRSGSAARQLLLVAFMMLILAPGARSADSKRDALWAAVRAGDLEAMQEAVEKGAEVSARNEYGVSALWIAAGKPKFDVIQFLVRKGADVNARDDIWYQTPLSVATSGGQIEMVKFLIKSGAKDVDAALMTAASMGNLKLAQAVLDESKVSQDALDGALYFVSNGTNKKLKEILEQAGAKPISPASAQQREAWAKLAGAYESDGGQKLTIAVKDVGLVIGGRYLKPAGPDNFVPLGVEGAGYRNRMEGWRGQPHYHEAVLGRV